ISVQRRGGAMRCTLGDDLELTVASGIVPMPLPTPQTYTHLDGVLRVTRFRSRGVAWSRPRGAELHLGSGPIADELRSLGLPKRALMTSSMPSFRATFGSADTLS